MSPRVAIVGAGYAGMAAAVALAARGVPVTVLESGPVPGGRAPP
ncbi:MAG TPA: FAD-dependent oxidoreductase, partial [Burkholderiales bacterium]|nr:FAD-dependent oxidoreductase [Burkholderiales bacterium]